MGIGTTGSIPGLLSLSEAIARALRKAPGGVAVSAELCAAHETFEVTVYRMARHDLVIVWVDGPTGEILRGSVCPPGCDRSSRPPVQMIADPP